MKKTFVLDTNVLLHNPEALGMKAMDLQKVNFDELYAGYREIELSKESPLVGHVTLSPSARNSRAWLRAGCECCDRRAGSRRRCYVDPDLRTHGLTKLCGERFFLQEPGGDDRAVEDEHP